MTWPLEHLYCSAISLYFLLFRTPFKIAICRLFRCFPVCWKTNSSIEFKTVCQSIVSKLICLNNLSAIILHYPFFLHFFYKSSVFIRLFPTCRYENKRIAYKYARFRIYKYWWYNFCGAVILTPIAVAYPWWNILYFNKLVNLNDKISGKLGCIFFRQKKTFLTNLRESKWVN